MGTKGKASCIIGILLSVLLYSQTLCAAEIEADTILYNGKIITVDQDFSIADSVAIKDGRILAVGNRGEVMRYYKAGKKGTVGNRGEVMHYNDPAKKGPSEPKKLIFMEKR